MKLYHASKHKFEKIERRQATAAGGVEVPASELQDKIYLTPDIGFAIAMAAGPEGMTSLVDGEISFENYEQFDESRPVYVYVVDSENLPSELLEKVDDEQLALDMDKIDYDEVKEFKTGDVFKYYKLTNWVHPNDL